jgi:hypothetical protein
METTLARAPSRVLGYHGCHILTSSGIQQPTDFLQSQNNYDWLGNGVYCWEYQPERALEWAQLRFGADNACVLEIDLTLGFCLNLVEPRFQQAIANHFKVIAEIADKTNFELPENEIGGRNRHFLDRFVIESFCSVTESFSEHSYQTVRGIFGEGEPIFPGSCVLSQSHIQIAVRDISCVAAVNRVL